MMQKFILVERVSRYVELYKEKLRKTVNCFCFCFAGIGGVYPPGPVREEASRSEN
jgi:hypothetical protein